MSKYEKWGEVTFSPTALTDKEEKYDLNRYAKHVCDSSGSADGERYPKKLIEWFGSFKPSMFLENANPSEEQWKYILQYDDTTNIANAGAMFSGCRLLTTVPLFDTSNVKNMFLMFY